MNSDVQRAVIEEERKDNIIQTYIKESTLPYVDVEVKSIVLDDLRQSPYSARIESRRSTRILRITRNSNGSDGLPASPMYSERT